MRHLDAARTQLHTQPPSSTTRLLSRSRTTALLLLIYITTLRPVALAQSAPTQPPTLTHWSFRPLHPVTPPSLGNDPTAKNPIDGFILQKLATARLTPSREADRITLIRRLCFDLTGLPPSPNQVDGFINDSTPGAYERLVDRLLSSPHFGERWGRRWLDAARYADSDGYEKDRPRPDAWRYRDWVIRSFNSNKPFNEFTIEQVAGDLLPKAGFEETVATAFHRQTLTNDEGGADKEQYRIEAVFDRLETTGTIWLGLTVGCARCHAHKYDPISQREYFSLFAFFNNADEVNRLVPTDPASWESYERSQGAKANEYVTTRWELDRKREQFAPHLASWETTIQTQLKEARQRSQPQRFLKLPALRESSSPNQGHPTVLMKIPPSAPSPTIRSLRFAMPSSPANPSTYHPPLRILSLDLRRGSTWSTATPIRPHSAVSEPDTKTNTASATLDDSLSTGWLASTGSNTPARITLHLPQPVSPEPNESLWIQVTHSSGSKSPTQSPNGLQIEFSADSTVESIAPEGIRRTLTEEPARRPLSETESLIEWAAQSDPTIASLTERVRSLRSQLPTPPLIEARTISQRSSTPRVTHVLKRGEFLSPGETVDPTTPALLPPLRPSPGSDPASKPPTRLDLARWLVNEAGFLTARVRVNQIWLHLFGEGLVSTPTDFGTRGALPSHPELLDWMADQFIRSNWNQKHLIRLIATSATYKQRSWTRVEAAETDPSNRLLHRQNRVRVDGEVIRDIYLASAGLLSDEIGGPSVFPPMPEDIAALSYANNFKWITSTGAARYRRGLYTFFKRTAPHPDLMTFDCPDANFALVRRHASNTPLQALTTLNAEAFVESAAALADRVLREAQSSSNQRITRLFRYVLNRDPQPRELETITHLLTTSQLHYRSHLSDAQEMIARAAAPAPDPSNPIERAAWATAARAVLNLDETITRE